MRRTILLVSVLLIVLLTGWMYWYYYNPFSDGTRVGMLQKFSRKGNVFKTYEGELLQEGFGRQGGGLSAQYFYFSVTDEAVAAALEKSQGQTVKIYYTQYRRSLPWRGEAYGNKNPDGGQYIVDRVEDTPLEMQR
ncbi:MAG: hypothetical protein EOP52_06440 [Sphingobacteriales bacterium]|nr:MAG: hypothetical protein EOP52_06440 [Sphingobacteriales bacterium]